MRHACNMQLQIHSYQEEMIGSQLRADNYAIRLVDKLIQSSTITVIIYRLPVSQKHK